MKCHLFYWICLPEFMALVVVAHWRSNSVDDLVPFRVVSPSLGARL